MIIAYDFDGTLVENAYPEIGEPRKGDMHPTLIEDVIELQKWGHKVILWTCRTGVHLDQAVEFCKKKGLIFDAVNDYIKVMEEEYRNQEIKRLKELIKNTIDFDEKLRLSERVQNLKKGVE